MGPSLSCNLHIPDSDVALSNVSMDKTYTHVTYKKELLPNCSWYDFYTNYTNKMASIAPLQAFYSTTSVKQSAVGPSLCTTYGHSTFLGTKVSSWKKVENNKKNTSLTVVAAVGDVSSDGTVYLIAGAAAVALLGTAFPILFSRKDL